MKKFTKNILTLVLLLALVLVPIKANAQETPGKVKIPVSKTIEKDDNVLVPAGKFEFTFTPNGHDNDLGVDDITISFTQGDTKVTDTEDFIIDESKILNLIPGKYLYDIKEVKPAGADKIDGLTYDETVKTLELTVYNKDIDAGTKGYIFTIPGKTYPEGTPDDAKVDLVKNGFTNIYTTETLVVRKILAGNAANKEDKFDITVTVNGVDGETYSTSVPGVVLESGVGHDFELGHKDEVEIYGLSEKDTYTVEEKDSKGYVVSYDKEPNDGYETVTVTNTLNQNVPMGVIEQIAPFALMLLVSVGALFIYCRKREEA